MACPATSCLCPRPTLWPQTCWEPCLPALGLGQQRWAPLGLRLVSRPCMSPSREFNELDFPVITSENLRPFGEAPSV